MSDRDVRPWLVLLTVATIVFVLAVLSVVAGVLIASNFEPPTRVEVVIKGAPATPRLPLEA